jgi:hypothetical protein
MIILKGDVAVADIAAQMIACELDGPCITLGNNIVYKFKPVVGKIIVPYGISIEELICDLVAHFQSRPEPDQEDYQLVENSIVSLRVLSKVSLTINDLDHTSNVRRAILPYDSNYRSYMIKANAGMRPRFTWLIAYNTITGINQHTDIETISQDCAACIYWDRDDNYTGSPANGLDATLFRAYIDAEPSNIRMITGLGNAIHPLALEFRQQSRKYMRNIRPINRIVWEIPAGLMDISFTMCGVCAEIMYDDYYVFANYILGQPTAPSDNTMAVCVLCAHICHGNMSDLIDDIEKNLPYVFRAHAKTSYREKCAGMPQPYPQFNNITTISLPSAQHMILIGTDYIVAETSNRYNHKKIMAHPLCAGRRLLNVKLLRIN